MVDPPAVPILDVDANPTDIEKKIATVRTTGKWVATAIEVVTGLVEFEVAVPRLTPALR